MFDNFYQGKRVFVTGHTGFKGTWLTIWLNMLGARVRGYSLDYPSSPCMFELTGSHAQLSCEEGDVRDFDRLKKSITSFQPDIVIHLAAQSLVRKSYLNPLETYSTNIIGTVHLLEAVRQVKSVRALINVTSDKCYENKETRLWGYRENDPMGGYDPYSCSKGCSELITSSYLQSFFNAGDYGNHGLALASVRSGNVIGGGDFASDRLIPDLVRAFMNDEMISLRNPNAVRPWQHVLEPLSGYLILAKFLYEEGRGTGGWNFGPDLDSAQRVEQVVTMFVAYWGEGNSIIDICDETNKLHEAQYLWLDCTKAKQLLKWAPRMRLEQAIKQTVEWYSAFVGSKQNLRLLTENQINDYMQNS